MRELPSLGHRGRRPHPRALPKLPRTPGPTSLRRVRRLSHWTGRPARAHAPAPSPFGGEQVRSPGPSQALERRLPRLPCRDPRTSRRPATAAEKVGLRDLSRRSQSVRHDRPIVHALPLGASGTSTGHQCRHALRPPAPSARVLHLPHARSRRRSDLRSHRPSELRPVSPRRVLLARSHDLHDLPHFRRAMAPAARRASAAQQVGVHHRLRSPRAWLARGLPALPLRSHRWQHTLSPLRLCRLRVSPAGERPGTAARTVQQLSPSCGRRPTRGESMVGSGVLRPRSPPHRSAHCAGPALSQLPRRHARTARRDADTGESTVRAVPRRQDCIQDHRPQLSQVPSMSCV